MSTPLAPASPGHSKLIRKLQLTEAALFRDHLRRLDPQSRRMRFAHAVADSFIEDYAARMLDNGAIVHGCFVNGVVRGVAELRKLGDTWGREAEAAFSVEKAFQDEGFGSELMGRVIRSARNRGVQLLYMTCLPENERMQAIARKHEADLRFEYGEVVGEIVPDGASYFSWLAEAVDDRLGTVLAVLDLQRRLLEAA